MNMPEVGFGTFRLLGEVAYQAVSDALRCGYRHIDTAQVYDNEVDVGRAITDSGVLRNEVFLTTKVWNDNLTQQNFLPSVRESLKKLRTDYVDLLLIHWPAPPQSVTLNQCIEWLIEARDAGLTRQIGVSNFTIAQLEQIKTVVPLNELATNQVEVHPYLQNRALRDYCRGQGLNITGYMPFAVGKVLTDEAVVSIANKLNRSPAEIVMAWARQKDITAIPSSTKVENMKLNIASIDVTLSQEQIDLIDSLDCGDRQATPPFSPEWD